MRIAYITSEYPPDIAQGGIATYTLQVAQLMRNMGHDVEVFSGSYTREISEYYNNILTHRILILDIPEFKRKVIQKFSERQRYKRFDVIESAEIGGDAYEVINKYPEIPLVVKMHTPAVLITRIMNTYVPIWDKLRFIMGALRRGKIDLGYWSRHDKNQAADIDYKITEKAKIIVSPSLALKKWAIKFWRLDKNQIVVIPNPYVPNDKYLQIPIEGKFNRITFIGKLNVLKGMVILTKVIKLILKKHKQIQFRLVGPDQPSHLPCLTFKQYISNKLGKLTDRVEFMGAVDLEKIPDYLRDTDICIFPSLWENFPTVCLEAMSAGKAIVASNVGGFREMITNKQSGFLVNPHKARKMVKSLERLIQNDKLRFSFGVQSRKTVLEKYNALIIGKEIEDNYLSVINKTVKTVKFN